MSSPVFDGGTGKAFAQDVLNALLFGISFPDERNFSVKAHVIASLANCVLGLLYIVAAFVPVLYFRIAVAVVVPILYAGLSFLTRERQAQRLRDRLSLGAEFANAFMYQFTPITFKCVNAMLNIGSFLFFTFAVELNRMNAASGIFLAMALIHSLRAIESTMNKSMPVNELEPALSLVVYSGFAFGLSFVNAWLGFALFTVYPFLTFSGLIPQANQLFQWIGEKVCQMPGLFLVQPTSMYVGAALVIVAAMHPSSLPLFCIALSLGTISFCSHPLAKMLILLVLSVGGIAYSIVGYLVFGQFAGAQIGILQWLLQRRYISLCIGGALSVVFFPLVFALRPENLRKISYVYALVVSVAQGICGFALGVFFFVEYLDYLHVRLYNWIFDLLVLVSASRVCYPMFYPLESFAGLLLGGWLNFIADLPCFVSMSVGICIFNAINRMAQMFVYQHHQCRLCFKTPLRGWQLQLHRLRALLYVWNALIFLICAVLDIPALPVGGVPFYLPFHPHPMSFFTLKSVYKCAGRKETAVAADNENKDDIAIYDVIVGHMFKWYSSLARELRTLTFAQGFTPAGSVCVLMSDKKMLFMLNTGANLMRSSFNYLVYALETVETSCHTLERTCLERFADYRDTQQISKLNIVQMQDTPTLIPVSYVNTSQLTPARNAQPKKIGASGQPQRQENHLPANVPLFNDSWLCKFKGSISTNDVSQNEYSLAGMLTDAHQKSELARMFVCLLYCQLASQGYDVIATLAQYAERLRESFEERAESVAKTLYAAFKIDLNQKRQQAVIGACIYTNFAYVFIESDQQIPQLYRSIKAVMKNDFSSGVQKQVQRIITATFRAACYYAIQQAMMGDELAASPAEFAYILESQRAVLLSHPSEPVWAAQLRQMTCEKMFAITEGLRALEQTVQLQTWSVYHLPSYYYRAIWSSLQTDLLVFHSIDDERFSVQSLPAALRNLFCESAGSPFGYPLVEYGQGVI